MSDPAEERSSEDGSAPSLTGDEVADKANAFFGALDAATACPVCRNETWQVIANGELQPGLPMTGEWQARSMMPYVPLIGLACERCGFVRLHLRQRVLGE